MAETKNKSKPRLHFIIFLVSAFILSFTFFSPNASAAYIKGTVYDYFLEPAKNIVVEINSTPKQVVVAKDGAYSFSVSPGSYTISANFVVQNKTKVNLQDIAEEKIVVQDEGTYIIDMIMVPSAGLESEFNETIDVEDISSQKINYLPLIIASAVFLIIIFAVFKIVSMKSSKYVNEILEEMKSERMKTERKAGKKPGKKKVDIDKKNKKRRNAIESAIKQEKIESPEHIKLDSYERNIIELLSQNDGRTTQKEIRKQFPLSEAKISLIISDLERKKLIKKIKKGRGNIILLEK